MSDTCPCDGRGCIECDGTGVAQVHEAPWGLGCEHGCCPDCCVRCHTADDLREKNCYCGHPLCYFTRSRLRARGPQNIGFNPEPIDCVCAEPSVRPYMLRALADRRKAGKPIGEFDVRPATGIVLLPTGTRVFVHSCCTKCLGEGVTEIVMG